MSQVHSSSGFSTSAIKPHLPFSILPISHSSSPPYPKFIRASRGRSKSTALQASSENLAAPSPAPAPAAAEAELSSQSLPLISASDVVKNFYGGINLHDLSSVEGLIAQNCVYEDLIFPQPFVGRKAILEFFQKFIDYISTDLQFVIDAISEEDSTSVGVTWHLEWRGKTFPFSRGCSFYRLKVVNGIRQITYARDCVEPAIKPGESALIIIRGVTWLLQWFPGLVDWL